MISVLTNLIIDYEAVVVYNLVTITPTKTNGKENNKMDDASMIMQVFGKLLVEDQELFVKFLRELCAQQDIEDKKELASSAHPTGENTY